MTKKYFGAQKNFDPLKFGVFGPGGQLKLYALSLLYFFIFIFFLYFWKAKYCQFNSILEVYTNSLLPYYLWFILRVMCFILGGKCCIKRNISWQIIGNSSKDIILLYQLFTSNVSLTTQKCYSEWQFSHLYIFFCYGLSKIHLYEVEVKCCFTFISHLLNILPSSW